MKSNSRYRWFVVAVFFVFMLLHQADRLLIGPLTTPIMETFHINEAQMGAVFTGALIVGAILYPIWGYLYDRFSRPKLLALASFIWGSTTWISAIAPTYGSFLVTRASTGIDDSSYPGLYSLVADYFGPSVRGRIYGFLSITQPLGYMVGMVLAMLLSASIGWRGVFYITGSLGIVVAAVIFFGVREIPRGKGEPEIENIDLVGTYQFNWKTARDLLRKPTLVMIYTQGFFGVFPWNVIQSWFFRYLQKERRYTADEVLVTMVIAVTVLAGGYFVGGALGDALFKRTRRGRLLVSAGAVFVGAILLWVTLGVPLADKGLFLALLCLTALFIPFASANVLATIYDISLPEVRGTASAVEQFIESAGAAAAPLIAGLIAVRSSLGNAILLICVSTWLVCTVFLAAAAYIVPRDIAVLRGQLGERASQEEVLRAERAGSA